MTIFRSRDFIFPPSRLPSFPPTVVEEESQEDYGFDPIDIDAFTEVMKTREEDANRGESWEADLKLAVVRATMHSYKEHPDKVTRLSPNLLIRWLR